MAFPQGVYFRATDDQTDPTNYDALVSTGISYPFTTAQGNTVGWEAAPAGVRDRGGAGAVELRGIHFCGTTSKDFRIDLPATGSYNIRGAFGDQGSLQAGCKTQLLDTTTVFATPVAAGTTISGLHFYDATGVDRTSQSDWSTNNAALSNTFSSTIFRVRVGGSTGSASPIAAIYIDSAGGDVTVALTGVAGTSAAGSAGTGSLFTLAQTGVSATGSVGSVGTGSLFTIGLTGANATGQVGNVATGQGITGNEGTGLAGDISPSISLALTGVSAIGQCGTVDVAGDKTFALTGVQAAAAVGDLIATIPSADQGDPGFWRKHHKREEERRRKLWDEEREKRERRRAQVIAAFSGDIAPVQAEAVADRVIAEVERMEAQPEMETFDFDGLLASADRLQTLWAEYLERDDEEVLSLL